MPRVLRSGEPDLMSTWTRSSWGADDYEMWLAQRDAVGATSSRCGPWSTGSSPGSTATSPEGRLERQQRNVGCNVRRS